MDYFIYILKLKTYLKFNLFFKACTKHNNTDKNFKLLLTLRLQHFLQALF